MTSLLLAVIYLAFIGLGLPDSLLGAAWPAMQPSLGVPLSYAGILSMIIALGTIVSSLQSDRLTLRLGTGRVTTISVGMTAAALLGFSLSGSFWQLCLWAIPYGLGAGSVDAALNNYVALHYKSRHMSWLHCMWGIGATTGPYIMGIALARGAGWSAGYATIAGLQVLLTLLLLLSLPLWKSRPGARETAPAAAPAREQRKPLSLAAVLGIPGAREIMIAFFCYCALEQTCGLWASSFLHLGHGMTEERAAGLAALFFLGVTAGRAASGSSARPAGAPGHDALPSRAILRLCKDLGGRLVTVGSGAHQPRYLADHIQDACAVLKDELGFSAIATFSRLTPTLHAL